MHINYEIINTRDVIIANENDYMFVNMIAREDSTENFLNNITIGAGIANRLGLGKSDSVIIVSPLDINFSSMKIPNILYSVDSIYSIPVIEFDQRHVVFSHFAPQYFYIRVFFASPHGVGQFYARLYASRLLVQYY